ncbi:MAG: hypothetical protein WA093_04435 [Minisyncoccales bacterium]
MTLSETTYNEWLKGTTQNTSGLGSWVGDIINIGRSFIPSLGWYTLPILAGAGLVTVSAAIAAAITIGPKWGVFYGNPPPGYAGTIIQAFFPTRVERAKINPLDGKPFTKTVEINGKSTEVEDTEKVWTSVGTYVGSFVNLEETDIDAVGYVTKEGHVYNPETGEDDPVPEPSTDDKPAGGINSYLAHNFAHYYLGNLWLLARTPKREIAWFTRKGHALVKRQEWDRYIRITEVDTAFDVTEKEPNLDRTGFPWWVQVTIIYKIRHLGKAWVWIPNSDDLMIRLVRGALSDWWQENAILVYEGQDLDAPPEKNPTPPSVEALKGLMVGAEGNKDLAERFLEHLGRSPEPKPETKPEEETESEARPNAEPAVEQTEKAKPPKMTGLCLEIMNKYGREITNIVFERKGLAGKYADLLTDIKEAELERRADIIRSQGRRVVMDNVSKGMKSQINVIKEGGESARVAVLAGLFNENGKEEPTNEDKLTTAFLYKKELKQEVAENSGQENSSGSGGRKNFHKTAKKQEGEKK